MKHRELAPGDGRTSDLVLNAIGSDKRVAANDSQLDTGDDMCGRFVSFNSWAHLRETLTLLSPADLPPNYNFAPTQQVLVAREHDGEHEGVSMRWGLIPSWAKGKKMAQIYALVRFAQPKVERLLLLYIRFPLVVGIRENEAAPFLERPAEQKLSTTMPVVLASDEAIAWIDPHPDPEKLIYGRPE